MLIIEFLKDLTEQNENLEFHSVRVSFVCVIVKIVKESIMHITSSNNCLLSLLTCIQGTNYVSQFIIS